MLFVFLAPFAFADEVASVAPPVEVPVAPRRGLHLAPPSPPEGYTIGLGVGYAFDPLGPVDGSEFPMNVLSPNAFGIQFRGPRHTWAPTFSVGADDSTGGYDAHRDVFGSLGVSWYPTPHETTPVAAMPMLAISASSLYWKEGSRYWWLTNTATLAVGIHAQRWVGSNFAFDVSASGVRLDVVGTVGHNDGERWRDVGVNIGFRPAFSVMGTFYFERPRRTARAAAKGPGERPDESVP